MGTLGHRDSQRPPETQRQKQRYSVMRHGDTEKTNRRRRIEKRGTEWRLSREIQRQEETLKPERDTERHPETKRRGRKESEL